LVPKKSIWKAQLGFGNIPGGNHFLEVQYVEKILDREHCSRHNLKEGQIVIMYHSGTGGFGVDLGRLYARRMKQNRRQRIEYPLRKIALHMKKPTDISKKLQYYFSGQQFVAIDPNEEPGIDCLYSIAFSSNFGYANRIGIIVKVRDSLKQVFKTKKLDLRLLRDISHNSIEPFSVDSQMWIHRHNANALKPDRLSIVSGNFNVASYLVVGGENAQASLFSVEHGAGELIKAHMKDETSKIKSQTRIYQHTKDDIIEAQQYDTKAIDQLIKIFKMKDILKPVARLRPLGVLKEFKKGEKP